MRRPKNGICRLHAPPLVAVLIMPVGAQGSYTQRNKKTPQVQQDQSTSSRLKVDPTILTTWTPIAVKECLTIPPKVKWRKRVWSRLLLLLGAWSQRRAWEKHSQSHRGRNLTRYSVAFDNFYFLQLPCWMFTLEHLYVLFFTFYLIVTCSFGFE